MILNRIHAQTLFIEFRWKRFETAAIPNQPQEEIERLLHFVVVGAGPTGKMKDIYNAIYQEKSFHVKVNVFIVLESTGLGISLEN